MRVQIRKNYWVSIAIILCVFSYAQMLPPADLIGAVRTKLAQNSFAGAESEIEAYKTQHGITPEYLEALSWMARGVAATAQWDKATNYATETRRLCEQQLTRQPPASAKRKLDSEPHLSLCCVQLWRVMAIHQSQRGSKRT